MEYIQIPKPDFSFDEIAKEKAEFIIYRLFAGNGIKQYSYGRDETFHNRVIAEIETLGKNEKILCIARLLDYLINNRSQIGSDILYTDEQKVQYIMGVNKIRYHLYQYGSDLGYDFRINTFSEEEAQSINIKINEILEIVKVVKIGQEVLGEELQELKDELESIKSEKALGKKITLQRLKGVTLEFLLGKLKDESYDVVKTALIALLAQQGLNVAEIIPKLLGSH